MWRVTHWVGMGPHNDINYIAVGFRWIGDTTT